jgi:hypothetical protein
LYMGWTIEPTFQTKSLPLSLQAVAIALASRLQAIHGTTACTARTFIPPTARLTLPAGKRQPAVALSGIACRPPH